MATASTLAYGTVVGQFLVSASDSADVDTLPDAVPASGTVTFTPSAGVVLDYSVSPNPSAILRKPIVTTLDAQGYITAADGTRGLKLIATDNATVRPVGWTWVATYALRDAEGNALRTLTTQPFLVPSNGTVDLIAAMPIEESKGVLLAKGDKGDLTTLEIGTVTVGEPAVGVEEVGPVSKLSFTLPVNNLQIGTVTTTTSTPGIVGPQGPVGPKGDPGGWSASTILTAGTSFDTIITSGLYLNPQANVANAPSNSTNGGHLEVISSSNYVYQRYTPIAEPRETYVRYRNSSGTWFAWSVLTSTRVDQTAGRVIYQWDDVNNREQIVYGDTGHRRVETNFINGWTCAIASIRRVGSVVTFGVYNINPAAQTNAVAYSVPAGFRQAYGGTIGIATQTSPSVGWLQVNTAGDLYPPTTAMSSTGFIHVMTWHTLDAWPTTLPGTASGSIPNL